MKVMTATNIIIAPRKDIPLPFLSLSYILMSQRISLEVLK